MSSRTAHIPRIMGVSICLYICIYKYIFEFACHLHGSLVFFSIRYLPETTITINHCLRRENGEQMTEALIAGKNSEKTI